MSKIREYATKHSFNEYNNFAAACYNQNSIDELSSIVASVKNGASVNDVADETDCETWGITPQQWFEGIEAALDELFYTFDRSS